MWLLQAVGCCTNCPVPNQTTAQPKYKAANYDVMICWGVHLKGLIQQMTGYFERGRGVVTTSSGVVHGLKKGCQKPDCHHTATFTCFSGTVHSKWSRLQTDLGRLSRTGELLPLAVVCCADKRQILASTGIYWHLLLSTAKRWHLHA